MDIFTDIGLIIIVATLGGFIARFLKQPLIPAYILTGVLIGPVLGLVRDMAVVDVLSEIGIAFLLFIVGIELDLDRLKDVGAIASVGAIIQMGIAFSMGFILMYLMRFSFIISFYGGLILTFSSTMIVIKLLSDKSQLDTLHGRIIIGSLLMQDVVAVFLLSLIVNLNSFSPISIVTSLGYGVLLFGSAILLSKYIFPGMFRYAAKNGELFFLLSLAICFAFSLLFAMTGFSIAIGAFIAGVMLGNLPYNIEIISKVKSLRDFFATLFFVSLGIKVTFTSITTYPHLFVLFLILTTIIIPIITFLFTMMFGYSKKISFLTAIALTQVSEFALIATTEGVKLGHLGPDFLSLVIITALASITVTSYLLKYDEKLYHFFLPMIKIFDKIVKHKRKYEHRTDEEEYDTILVGYDRMGYNIYKSLKDMDKKVVIVDYNPDIIRRLIANKTDCIYGDISDEEILEKLKLKRVKQVISTIPNFHDNKMLVNVIKKHNKSAHIIVTAYQVYEALELYKSGVDYVIMPHFLGGQHAGILLQTISNDIDQLITTRLDHINELKQHHTKFHKKHSRDAHNIN